MNFQGFLINRTTVNFDLKDYIALIQNCVDVMSNANLLAAEDVKFECTQIPPSMDLNFLTFELLASYGIGILDAFLWDSMSKDENLIRFCVWTVVDDGFVYQAPVYPKAMTVAYFILMARAKIDFTESEPIPRFLISYCGVGSTKEELRRHLGKNDFSRIPHLWIRDMRSDKYSQAMIQRLINSIAGTRYFNAIRDQVPDKEGLSAETKRAYDCVVKIAKSGPYWTQHPFFYPEELKNTSLLKNLSNLACELYSPKILQSLVSNRTIYKLPKFDDRFIQYKKWDDSFTALFKISDKIKLGPEPPANDVSQEVTITSDEPTAGNTGGEWGNTGSA